MRTTLIKPLTTAISVLSISLSAASITPVPKSIGSDRTTTVTSSLVIQNANPEFGPVVQAFQSDWNIQPTKPAKTLIIVKNPALQPEEYRISAGDSIAVAASTPTGLAWALQSLGQSISSGSLPRSIQDIPDVPFRSVSLDAARRFHSIPTLKNLIRYCQAGKVRYVQLHLTDDQSWMFPTTVFRGVDKNNRHKKPAYTVAELNDLQAFASARGVTLIPEIDIPGHSSLLTALDPDLMRIQGSESTNCIDFASPEVRSRLRALIKEVAAVFTDSPYIHIGGDEAWYPNVEKDPDFVAALARLSAEANPNMVFVDFVADMASTVIKLGKTPLVWEGFSQSAFAKKVIPPQTVVIAWEGWYYPAKNLVADNFKTVNGGWDPYYVVNHYPYEMFTLAPLEHLYNSNPNRFGIVAWSTGHERGFDFPKTENLIGSLLCWWEGHEWNAQKFLPSRLLAFGASLWNRKGETSYSDFLRRYTIVRSNIDRQSFPFTITTTGLVDLETGHFSQSAKILAKPNQSEVTIAIRTDGEVPTANDVVSPGSVIVEKSSVIAIQAFKSGSTLGETKFIPVHKVTVIKNLAYQRPVTTSSAADPQFPASAITDGVSDQLSSHWLAYPAPQTATIDLGQSTAFNRIQVVAFWATGASTHYKISISDDNKSWRNIVDASQQTRASTPDGFTHVFPTTSAKFIRIESGITPVFPSTMARINEVRVFNDKQ